MRMLRQTTSGLGAGVPPLFKVKIVQLEVVYTDIQRVSTSLAMAASRRKSYLSNPDETKNIVVSTRVTVGIKPDLVSIS